MQHVLRRTLSLLVLICLLHDFKSHQPVCHRREKNSHGLLEVVVAGVTSFELTNSPYLAAKSFGRAQIEKVKVWLMRKSAWAVILNARRSGTVLASRRGREWLM